MRIYFRRENEISLSHVTFFRHDALAENQAACAAKRPVVQGLIHVTGSYINGHWEKEIRARDRTARVIQIVTESL